MEDPQIMVFPCIVRATGAGGGGERASRKREEENGGVTSGNKVSQVLHCLRVKQARFWGEMVSSAL